MSTRGTFGTAECSSAVYDVKECAAKVYTTLGNVEPPKTLTNVSQ